MSNYVRFAPVVTTTAALIGGLTLSLDKVLVIPVMQPDTYGIYESLDFGTSSTQYEVTSERDLALRKLETIHKFSSNLLENIEDLDPEFSKVIDENYWDLI